MSAPFTPPRLATWLLRLTLPTGVRGQTIAGDLAEEYGLRRTAGGPLAARWWYWRAAVAVSLGYSLGRDRHSFTQAHHSSNRASLMDSLLQDLRYAVRTLVKSRGFTAAALATLTIGIGASTAIFSVVNAVVIRPLPFAGSERIMFATELTRSGSPMSIAWPNCLDWRARLTSFADLACGRVTTFTLTGLDRAERLEGRQVGWNFLRVIGVEPAIGRGFTEADDRTGAPHVVLISDGFWKQRLGGDPAVLGRVLTLHNAPHTIVGVLPLGFQFVRNDAIYEPIGTVTSNPAFLDRGNHMGLVAYGRLRQGITAASAGEELKGLAATLAREYPATNTGASARLQTLAERVVGETRTTLIALMSAVGCLLLIACVNVANLLIARSAARRHELAVRAALGGGRLRLIRQLLVESSVISAAGGALGLAAGWGLLKILLALAGEQLPRLDEVRLDGAVLLFAFGAAVVSGLLFGLLPAIHASSLVGQTALIRSGRTSTAGQSHRLRRGLMVAEVAMALILLVGAGLMIRTMLQLTSVDKGFDPRNILTMRYSIAGAGWTDERASAFGETLVARTRALPGVTDAALTLSLPIEGSQWGSVFIVGDLPVPSRADLPAAAFTPVTPGYFGVFGLRLREGRLLADADRPGRPHVAVVNEAFARRFWPGQSPLGKRLKQGWPEWTTPWWEIVGVVNDVKLNGVNQDTPLQVYLPYTMSPSATPAFAVRSELPAAGLTASIEALVRELEPNLPVYDAQTMETVMGAGVARERISMVILSIFAGIALLLACIGLYGVVSHGVTERTREIGVRMALGANRGHVVGLFVGQGLVTTAAGIAIGLAGALALSKYAKGLLFNVTPTDPITFGTVVLTLAAVALVACYLPARRATRVDPTIALRGD